jgi:hypothetical protein
MLKDNILEDGMSIMSFNIGKLIVINDERTDVSTLKKHRGPYLQAHASVLSNIDTLSADVSRVFSLSFASILFGRNKDSEEWDTPNSTIFATLLSMFSLFDQCAVLLCNKLGEMISPEEAVFFGVKANQTVIELANRTRPEHVGLLLSAFGYGGADMEEERWRSLLTLLRGRIVHRQGVFFKSDLEKISHFIIEKGFKTTERDIYLSNNGNRHIHAFDFMCFLVFASEKLTSLVRLIQCY